MAEAAARVKVGAIEIPESFIARKAAPTIKGKTTVSVNAPTDNPIHKIIFSPNLTPEQQRAELAAYLTFTGTKEESKERVAAYQQFEEWLQTERERVSSEVIALTDTETFSELQSVIDGMGGSLMEIENRMKPFTDILDAVYVLRTNEKTLDAYAEIQQDRKAEAQAKAVADEKTQQLGSLRNRIDGISSSIMHLGEQRSFFGLGGVKQSAREQIADQELQLAKTEHDLTQLSQELVALQNAPGAASDLGEFAEQKTQLRKLLDIKSDTHKERQRELVGVVQEFIAVSKDRIGSVREHMGRMTNQIDAVYDSNSKITGVYAVMGESVNDALTKSGEIREGLKTPADSEGLITKMTREEKLGAVEDHIRALDTAAGSTVETFADLTSQTIRIRTMRDSNATMLDKTRRIHNQGIAGVADRLSVVLNAISAAALGESAAMAKDTLVAMTERTNAVTQKEVIGLALGTREINHDLEKAIADLGDIGEVLRTSTSITRESLADVHANMDKMKELAEGVRGDIRDASAAHAEIKKAAE